MSGTDDRRRDWLLAPPSADELATLPKVELHVHLEGSIRAETAIDLAVRHDEDPDDVLPLVDGDYPDHYEDFTDFVELYLAVTRQVRSPDDLAAVAAAFARQQAENRVRYTEVTFTASTLVNHGMAPEAMWSAVSDGLRDAGPDTEIQLIIDAVRDLGPSSGERTIELVRDADAPIAGFGLAGDERANPAAEFADLRTWADRLGIGFAVHAGETGPASNVAEALAIGADRIGHGVAVVHDEELLARVIEEQIPLEVCPSSNVVLGVVEDLASHPFADLWRAGANVTVNSDDPPLFFTRLTDEIAHAVRLAKLTIADVATLQRRAARATFLPRPRQQLLVAQIDTWERDVAAARRRAAES